MFIRIDVFWGISMAITEIDGSLSAANCYHNQLKWRKTGMRHKMIINACRRNVVWMFIITPVKPLISLTSQWLEGRYCLELFYASKNLNNIILNSKTLSKFIRHKMSFYFKFISTLALDFGIQL